MVHDVRRGFHSHTVLAVGVFAALACFACAGPDFDAVNAERERSPENNAVLNPKVVINADIYQDGTTKAFSPFQPGYKHAGDTITWHFPTASPGNSVVRRVYDGTLPAGSRYIIAPYNTTAPFVNEIAGPMIKAPSGVFALSPTAYALKEQTAACAAGTLVAQRPPTGPATAYLCRDTNVANNGKTLNSTWSSPEITGVFIRLQWKDFQPTKTTWKDGEADLLATEADKAVANGKLFSVMLESGRDGQPGWLLTPVASGGAGLTGITLVVNDAVENLPGQNCGPADQFTYADPTSLSNPGAGTYLDLYKAALTRVADVLKRKSSRYRALAYIKPSGANRATGENRLPTRCRSGCICNNQKWAEAHYTPNKLYAFYTAQFAHIAQKFPNKSMSYMSMPAGFPRVGQGGCYDGVSGTVCPSPTPKNTSVPGGEEQTNTIIANAFLPNAVTSSPGAFVVEFQGLDTRSTSVNQQVANASATGRPTMYQTSAEGQVGTPAQVGETLAVLYDYSASTALEIYEERLWQANGLPLGSPINHVPDYATRTIGAWNTELHNRRRTNYAPLGDPAPLTYLFLLGTPVPIAPNTKEFNYYVDPRIQPVTQAGGCLDGFSPCIIVEP